MKLFRDAELIPTCDWHLHWVWRVRVSQAFFQIVEFHVSGDFDLYSHTAVFISWKSYSASNSEAAWSLYLYFKFESVDLSHTLDFLELNCVSIIETVSFILMQINSCFLLLSDSSDVDEFWFLSGKVKNFVGITKIDECVSIQTQVTGQNEADLVLSTGLV